jgi:hypothetical protein
MIVVPCKLEGQASPHLTHEDAFDELLENSRSVHKEPVADANRTIEVGDSHNQIALQTGGRALAVVATGGAERSLQFPAPRSQLRPVQELPPLNSSGSQMGEQLP